MDRRAIVSELHGNQMSESSHIETQQGQFMLTSGLLRNWLHLKMEYTEEQTQEDILQFLPLLLALAT